MPELPDVADEVRRSLERLEITPVAEHVVAYDEVHRLLQDALGRLDGD